MPEYEIIIGFGSCGIAAGARRAFDIFAEEAEKSSAKISVKPTGCIGACHREPLVGVRESDGKQYLYGEVDEKRAGEIINRHIHGGEVIRDWLVKPDYPYFTKQKKIVLANSGIIDPENMDEYIKVKGYKALKKVLFEMTPEELIEDIKASGLRGRGGAGFPTGLKWGFARNSMGDKKYMICNADEGDPGAFMDRSVLEGDPHAVLEGMIIGAYAIGADEGFIYVRAEYPLAIKRLNIAIAQAKAKGLLGDSIMNSGFSFNVHIKEGAGAFVCGEETALMASIEGKRGMPRLRPPYPAVKGLWGAPTNINNVETLANVPAIIRMGGHVYAETGTEKSKGTKVFALAGKIKRGGMVEVPMGTTLREVIFDIGGGIQGDKKFRAVQLGGPSGGCIPGSLLDTPVDYDSLTSTGAIMGSGGMVVMDESTCMVDVARFFLSFTQNESCGKCTFCRIGTKRMLEILERITMGHGGMEDIDKLEELAVKIKVASLCALGQTAPNPVLTTLKYFREEYEDHILRKKCPAKKCKALIRFKVVPENCTGCTLCVRVCPTGSVHGERRQIHEIDPDLCIKCGLCEEACHFDAIEITTGDIKAGVIS